jgi:hypothetical protein
MAGLPYKGPVPGDPNFSGSTGGGKSGTGTSGEAPPAAPPAAGHGYNGDYSGAASVYAPAVTAPATTSTPGLVGTAMGALQGALGPATMAGSAADSAGSATVDPDDADGMRGRGNAGAFFDEYGNNAISTLEAQRGQYQGSLDALAGGAVQTGLDADANLRAIGNEAARASTANATALDDRAKAYAGANLDAGGGALDYGLGQGGAIGDYGTGQAAAVNKSAGGMFGAGQAMGRLGDYAQGRDISNAQQQALMGLEAQAGPSAAQGQLAQATAQNQANALAMARSGRGWGGSASAMQQAAAQRVGAQQQAANQSAVLLAQEEAARRQRAAANIGAAGQLATQQSGLNDQQQQALYGLGLQGMNAGTNAQIASGQLGLAGLQGGAQIGQNAYAQNLGALQNAGNVAMQGGEYAAGLQQQGIEQQGQLYGQGAQTALAGQQLGGQLYGSSANYGMQNIGQQGQTMQAGLGYNENVWNRDVQREGIKAGVSVQNQNQQNTMLGAGMSAGGIALSMLPLLMMASDRNMKEDIKPANSELVLPKAGSAEPVYDPFSQGVGVSGPNQMPGGANAGADASKAAAGAAKSANAFNANQAKSNALLGNAGSGLMGIGQGLMSAPSASIQMPQVGGGNLSPMITSDKNEKESLKAMEEAPGYSYNYKDPDAMGATSGRQYGVMAQDLEKTPAGRSVVREVNGHKMVDTSRLTLVNTAAMNALVDRVSALEARNKKAA